MRRIKDILVVALSFAWVKTWVYSWMYSLLDRSLWRLKASIGKSTTVHPTAVLRQPSNIVIGRHCMVNASCVLQAGYKEGFIRLSDYVQLGPNVMMFAYNHQFRRTDVPSIFQGYDEDDINIGANVWVGAGAIILAGTSIGKNSVVGAGAIVKGVYPENSMILGSKTVAKEIQRD